MTAESLPAAPKWMRGATRHFIGYAFAAGMIYPLAFAPFAQSFLALLSVGVLSVLLHYCNPRSCFLIGYCFGLGKYGIGVSWIYVSIHEFGGASPALAAFLVALFVAGFSLLPALFGFIYARVGRGAHAMLSMLAFAALWLLHEWLHMWLLTGFPWLLLGYAGLDTSFEGLAPVGGVLLVSFVMALFSSGFAFAALAGRRSDRIGCLCLAGIPWLLSWAFSFVEWSRPYGEVSVALAQGSVPQALKWQPEHLDLSLDTYRELIDQAWDNDLIVLPEAAIPLTIDRASDYLRGIEADALASGTGVVLGIPKLVRSGAGQGWAFHNTAIGLGLAEGEYAKRHLVPFGEYVPLEETLRGLIDFFDLPMSYAEPGAALQAPISLGDGEERIEIATAICYEIAFPELIRGSSEDPGFIITLSNDAWFGNSFGPRQHLQIAKMRAVEFGRYVLRATNNGVTAIIAPRKPENYDVRVWAARRNEREVLRFRAQLMRGKTPYHQWGNDWLILSIGLFALFIALWKLRRTE